MPDFIPVSLMKFFNKIEAYLEQSTFREYSVHYMAVVEKDLRRMIVEQAV